MPYHNSPIDDHGFLSATKVLHFPKEPTMGYVLVPDSLNPYPPTVGVQPGGWEDDDCLPSNSGAFTDKWLENKWSRYQKSPNIVFPYQAFDKIASVRGYSGGFTKDTSITSWMIELWVWPDGIQDSSKWSTTDASNRYTLLQLGSLIDNDAALSGYPFTIGSDALHTGIYFYNDIYPLIYWSMKTGDAGGDKDDYKVEYLFDTSRLLQLNAWNHIVFEWHYGGSELDPDPAEDGFAAYYAAYDPTCRVWVNGDEAMRGLKDWVITVPFKEDLYDTQLDTPSYVGGNIVPAAQSNKDCEGLPRVEVGYLGGRCRQHDSGRTGGWQSTGSIITAEQDRDYHGDGYQNDVFDWVDYNFKGYMTEFRVWKNKRVSGTGYRVKNSDAASDTPMLYRQERCVGNEDGLVAYYPMKEGTGTVLYDKTMDNNLPAHLVKTPVVTRFYPEDANADAVNNIRWATPPDGLRFKEAEDTDAVFIKQDRVHPLISVDSSNNRYDSDVVTFGELYDTVGESGITNFSFTDSKNQRLAPQIGDYLLMKWNVDPSCLKRDMLQTMTNIVTISLPYYREPYPVVVDLFYENQENPDDPPAPLGPDDVNEPWMAILFGGPDPSSWLDEDHTGGVRFTYSEPTGPDFSVYRGFNPYKYHDATNEMFENIFAAKSANANLTMKDFTYDNYYFVMHVEYGSNNRRTYHSRNAIPYMLATLAREDHMKPLWGMLGDGSSVPQQRSPQEIKQQMTTYVVEASFGGKGTAADPHILTMKTPYDDASNRILSTIKSAKLEVYNKYSTLTKDGALVTTEPKVSFGPTPYGELAFFKREN